MDAVTAGAQVYATAEFGQILVSKAIARVSSPATRVATVLPTHPKGTGSNYPLGKRVMEESWYLIEVGTLWEVAHS